MVSESPHSLCFAAYPDSGGRVKSLGLNDGKRYIAVDDIVVSLVDSLPATLAEEASDPVATIGEGCGIGHRRFEGRWYGRSRTVWWRLDMTTQCPFRSGHEVPGITTLWVE